MSTCCVPNQYLPHYVPRRYHEYLPSLHSYTDPLSCLAETSEESRPHRSLLRRDFCNRCKYLTQRPDIIRMTALSCRVSKQFLMTDIGPRKWCEASWILGLSGDICCDSDFEPTDAYSTVRSGHALHSSLHFQRCLKHVQHTRIAEIPTGRQEPPQGIRGQVSLSAPSVHGKRGKDLCHQFWHAGMGAIQSRQSGVEYICEERGGYPGRNI